LIFVDGLSFVCNSYEAAAAVVYSESVGESAGVDFYTAVGDCFKVLAVSAGGVGQSAEFVGDTVKRAAPPIQNYINAETIFVSPKTDNTFSQGAIKGNSLFMIYKMKYQACASSFIL